MIFKLLRHYCIQLRRSQARSPLQVEWGSPVIPGQIFAGTLRQRKRGARIPVPVVSLSDDDMPNNASQDGWMEAKPARKLGIKDNPATRKRKRPNVIDSDSDLEDFQIGNTYKSQRTLKVKDSKQSDFDVDVYNLDNIDENVPLLKIDVVANLSSRDKIDDVRDIPGTSGKAINTSSGSGGRNGDVGVTSGINENEDDASQTLAYDDDEYNADTEEFKQDNQTDKDPPGVDNEASSLAQNEDIARSEDTKAPCTSGASAAPSEHTLKDRGPSSAASQEVSDIDSRETNAVDLNDKDDLVDSTTISVLRKSRQSKRKDESQHSQGSQNGLQAAVSSSETHGNLTGADQTIRKPNANSDSTNSRGDTTNSQENVTKSATEVEQMASTSENRSVAERTVDESNEVETSSESRTKVPSLRTSPVDGVSSMPKTVATDDDKQSSSTEAGGVTSSKEAARNKTNPHLACDPVYIEKFCFEEVRSHFYANQSKEEDSAVDESSTTSASSNTKNNENDLPSDLEDLVKEACSDALAASKSEGVSSSLFAKMKPGKDKPPERVTKTKGVPDVASTSDNTENETGEPSKAKPSMTKTRERHARHQSPGVASSSDDQGASVRQRTGSSDHEAETSSSTEGAAIIARVSKKQDQGANVRQRAGSSDHEAETSSSSEGAALDAGVSRKQRGQMEGAVESSGLDSDASGVVLRRPARGKPTSGERALGIGSSDEATTSEENAGSSKAKPTKVRTIYLLLFTHTGSLGSD